MKKMTKMYIKDQWKQHYISFSIVLILIFLAAALSSLMSVVIGKIVEVDKTSHGDFSVIIENEITKEKLDIGFIHKNLKEGEKVEVYYLPHLKIGSIYKIQQ